VLPQLACLRASGHRLAPYGVAGPSRDGWTAVPVDTLAALALRSHSPGCAIDCADELTVTVFGPDGEVVWLDAVAGADAAARAAALLGQPRAGDLVHRALTVEFEYYDTAARVADVCRAVGIPVALLDPDSTVDSTLDASVPDVVPDVGFVLVRLDIASAVAEAPLARQSAWLAPMGPAWTIHVWDGEPPRHPLPAAAIGFSQGHRDGPALALWWASDRAGFLLATAGRAVCAHEWSRRLDLGIDHTAGAGRSLAAAFRVAERALDVTAVLRREPSDPVRALVDLLRLLDVPTELVGRTSPELIEAVRSARGAVHAPRLSPLRSVAHAMREAPATNLVDRAVRERPWWYRIVNAVVAVLMALLTFALYLSWHHGTVAGWWVALSAATTVSYAVAVRPARRR
jgi:hypothetical protein